VAEFVLARAAAGPAPACRQRGVTLTELFAVVAIAGVLAAIALPNLQEFVKNNARASRMNTLVTALNYARSDAVSRRRTTVVCPPVSASDLTCAGAGTNSFHSGIVVRTGPGEATLLRTFETDASGNYTLVGLLPGATPAPLWKVAFDPSGRATLNADASVAVATARFLYCDQRDDATATNRAARAIVLSASGHPRSSTDANDDGIHDVNGVNLSCS